MGLIINIDEALKQRTGYNILREPLNDMLTAQQEAWERENPIDMLFVRGTIDRFQETYTSTIGFEHAFAETGDYNIGPIFNTAEGFAATYRTKTFQGSFIITQQVLEDGLYSKVKDDATQFIKRWHGDVVEYAMTAIDAGFGEERQYGYGNDKSRLKLQSADTSDGDITTETKNPLFYKTHTCVKREGMTNDDVIKQSNFFYANVDLLGDDTARLTKLADAINQVITAMENYKDDNGKYAGVLGAKTIVAPNDPQLKAALESILAMDMFKQGESMVLNPAYKRATLKTTPYLNDITACTKDATKHIAKGLFIVDKSYNESNHGPEFTERIPLTLDVINQDRPKGIVYDGRQRFDINVATWRGIAYLYIGTPSATATDWNYSGKMTELTLSDTLVKEVRVTNSVINTNASVTGSITNTPTT